MIIRARASAGARVLIGLAAAMLLGACSGGPGAATASLPTAAPPVATAAPLATAAAVTGTGPSIETIFGEAPPAEPAGTTWIRVSEDHNAFSFEVPSTWAEHQTTAWPESDGSSSGSILTVGTKLAALGTDFAERGIAVAVTANPGGRTPADVVGGTDYSGKCTGTPAGTDSGTGYTAAYRVWTACGGRPDAFLFVVVVNPTGSNALFVVVFQGAEKADLGYVQHIFNSVQTSSGTPTVTAPPINAQGWTITVDECLSQMNDAIAVGRIRNVDTREHSYRIYVRFTSPTDLLIGEDYWDTPTIDPGQEYKYEVRHMALNGTNLGHCTVSDVLIRN